MSLVSIILTSLKSFSGEGFSFSVNMEWLKIKIFVGASAVLLEMKTKDGKMSAEYYVDSLQNRIMDT